MTRKITILVPQNKSLNNESFLFPLLINKDILNDYGLQISISNEIRPSICESDIIIVTSKYASQWKWWETNRKEKYFCMMQTLRNNSAKLIWADLSDSTGTTQFEILPYVDLYMKGAVLKDKSHYMRKMYGSRLFTEYYHDKYGISDDNEGEEHLNYIPEKDQLDKLKLGWNFGLYNYNYKGYLYGKMRKYIPVFPPRVFHDTIPVSRARNIEINIRFNTKYKRNTVAYQRMQISYLINEGIKGERISRKKYYNELQLSSVAISPFGWGELCYRDYETFYYGAALLKPNCDHLTTWPNYFQNGTTYIPFKWDLSDLKDKILMTTENQQLVKTIAENGQRNYLYYLTSEEGRMEFCVRLLNIINK